MAGMPWKYKTGDSRWERTQARCRWLDDEFRIEIFRALWNTRRDCSARQRLASSIADSADGVPMNEGAARQWKADRLRRLRKGQAGNPRGRRQRGVGAQSVINTAERERRIPNLFALAQAGLPLFGAKP